MKRALVTGGNKGIGLETARLLHQMGYQVVVIARDFSSGSLRDLPGTLEVRFDLREVEAIPALIAEVGHVDILVNNAGILNGTPFDNYPEEKVETILKVNIEAPVALIREVSATMIKKGSGRIVNNASIAGQIGHPDVWYGITKAALINATKSFARLLGPKGIIINAVATGPAETDMLRFNNEERKRVIRNSVFSGRFATAGEVARTIIWLAVESPDYINGTCIDINNGAFPR